MNCSAHWTRITHFRRTGGKESTYILSCEWQARKSQTNVSLGKATVRREKLAAAARRSEIPQQQECVCISFPRLSLGSRKMRSDVFRGMLILVCLHSHAQQILMPHIRFWAPGAHLAPSPAGTNGANLKARMWTNAAHPCSFGDICAENTRDSRAAIPRFMSVHLYIYDTRSSNKCTQRDFCRIRIGLMPECNRDTVFYFYCLTAR